MKHLYPRFYKNIKQNNLINKNDTVISAFSGGKDSVTMLLLLERLREDIQFELKAAYYNHRIRPDATEEELWIDQFFSKMDIELIKGTGNVITFKSRNKLNLENAASISRYDFFNKVADKFSQSKIATGHSKSDLTETFFIKLFRGSGLQGLSGIFGLKGERIIRPLLLFSKSEILEFLKRSGTEHFTDPTNKSTVFLRNNIRQNLIPEIEKIEPHIDKHIFRTVSIIQEEFEYFRSKAQNFLKDHLICGKVLKLKTFQSEPMAMKRHIIREFIRSIKGDLLNIDFDHIEQLTKPRIDKKGISIPGINFSIKRGFLFDMRTKIPGYEYQIRSTGETEIPEICSRIRIENTGTFSKPKDIFEIILPADKLIFPIVIRNSEKKDKYKKINSEINQKVFEMIRCSGVPSEIRNFLPVVVNGNKEIITVCGSNVSDLYKVSGMKGDFYRIRLISPLS
ncbi:MAG: tRNA lysidine(34) synthetase TilS [Acidobacteriota bacterium]